MNPSNTSPEAETPAGDVHVHVKRQRKREQDRLAQRAARDRTRQRIASLEATVEGLQKHGAGARIAELERRLARANKQRDDLAQVISSIELTIQSQRVMAACHGEEVNLNLNLNPNLADAACLPQVVPEVAPETVPEVAESEPEPVPEPGPQPEPAFQLDFLDSIVVNPPTPLTDSVILPYPDSPCDCVAMGMGMGMGMGMDMHMDMAISPASSIWRSANQVLGSPCHSSDQKTPDMSLEDASSDDTPIRAILDGWDAVEQAGKMTPLWRKMRAIDELQFSHCHKTERLAILTLMHLLLRYHLEPTEARHASIPPWYHKRPSQVLPHSYAINFFVWPGVRERFVFSQHRYCSNDFWRHFTAGFHLLWPFEFRDCYRKNIATDSHSLSPEFRERICRIDSWAMSPEFFAHFPELYGDIPATPGSLTWFRPRNRLMAASNQDLDDGEAN